MGQKPREVFQLVGSDRSRWAAECCHIPRCESTLSRILARNGAPAATRTRDPRLLRNDPLELFSGFEIDEREAERGGALAQTAEHARAMVRVIRRSPRI